jgi:omega-6 fatty acid desaturase (delta-12 desaturase)
MHSLNRHTKDSPPAELARHWRAVLPRAWRHSSAVRGLLVVALSAAVYVGTFLGMFLLPTWWARLICLIIQPVAIGMLFVIGHDAGHNSLTPVGWLNRLLGRLVMLPAYHPYSAWCHAHNTMHHGWTNFKGRHPDFPPFTKQEFDGLPRWRRLLERFYRTPVGIGPFYVLDFYVKHLLLPRPDRRPPSRVAFLLDRLSVLLFFVAQITAAYLLTGYTPDMIFPRWFYAGFAVVAAWATWIWFMGFVSFVQHTHPRMAWYDDEEEWSFYHVQLRSTAHVKFPWPIERLLNNIMDHPAHHLDPTIPLYNLTGSQRLLEEVAGPHAVVYRWTPADFWRTCAACKLYDFERHCWTDFAGVPTTPCNLPEFPPIRQQQQQQQQQQQEQQADERRPEDVAGPIPAA